MEFLVQRRPTPVWADVVALFADVAAADVGHCPSAVGDFSVADVVDVAGSEADGIACCVADVVAGGNATAAGGVATVDGVEADGIAFAVVGPVADVVAISAGDVAAGQDAGRDPERADPSIVAAVVASAHSLLALEMVLMLLLLPAGPQPPSWAVKLMALLPPGHLLPPPVSLLSSPPLPSSSMPLLSPSSTSSLLLNLSSYKTSHS